VTTGEAELERSATDPARTTGGWTVNLETGNTGDDLVQRAVVAKTGWGANIAAEAVYARAAADLHGAALTGTTSYRIHFPRNQLPPVNAFWSVTLYGPDGFFAPNDQNRFAIGDRTPALTMNADGSLDILVQHNPPASTANWLPSPSGPFILMLRMYLPRPPVLEGSYQPPPVEPST
jgi:hypothetical protein